MSRLFVVGGVLIHTYLALGLVQRSSNEMGRVSMDRMSRMSSGASAEASVDLLFRRTYAAADSLFRRVGLDRTYGMRPAEFSEVMENSWPKSNNASCQDAQPGSMCYRATAWLHDKGVANHPEWYPSLSEESTMQEVQFVLYALGKAFCTMPCQARGAKPLEESPDDRVLEVDDSGRQVESEGYELSEPEECGDAVEGDWCYLSIMWLQHVGLSKHPDWYPTLLHESSTRKFQTVLHDEHKVGCPLPCSSDSTASASAVEQEVTTTRGSPPQAVVSPSVKRVDETWGQCTNARLGSRCYEAITHVLDKGLFENPEEYPELTPDVTRQEVQEHLYLRGQFECDRPCPKELIEKIRRPVRVKKSPDDMTVEELSRYLSHEWDGYVDSDEYTSAVATHVSSAKERAFEEYTNAVAADGAPATEDAEGANASSAEDAPRGQQPAAAEGALEPKNDVGAEALPVSGDMAQGPPEAQNLSSGDAADGCGDASDGELCYSAVTWARRVGIIERPKWYPGLSESSTFKDFQAYLHKARGSLCQMPCPEAADAPPLVWSDGAWAPRPPEAPAAPAADATADENATVDATAEEGRVDATAEENATDDASSPVEAAFPEPGPQVPDLQNSTLEGPAPRRVTEEDILQENERLRAEVEALTTTQPQPESKRSDRRSKRSKHSKRSKSKRSASTAEEEPPPRPEAATVEAGAGFSDEALPVVDGDGQEVNSTVQELVPQPGADSTVQEPAPQPEAATGQDNFTAEEPAPQSEVESKEAAAAEQQVPQPQDPEAAMEEANSTAEEPAPQSETASKEATAEERQVPQPEEKPVPTEITEDALKRENELLRAEVEALTSTTQEPQPESRRWGRRSKRSKSKRSKSSQEPRPEEPVAATEEASSTAEEPAPQPGAAAAEAEVVTSREPLPMIDGEGQEAAPRPEAAAEEANSTAEEPAPQPGAAAAEATAGVSDVVLPVVDGDEQDTNSTVQEPAPRPEVNSTVQETAPELSELWR